MPSCATMTGCVCAHRKPTLTALMRIVEGQHRIAAKRKEPVQNKAAADAIQLRAPAQHVTNRRLCELGGAIWPDHGLMARRLRRSVRHDACGHSQEHQQGIAHLSPPGSAILKRKAAPRRPRYRFPVPVPELAPVGIGIGRMVSPQAALVSRRGVRRLGEKKLLQPEDCGRRR